MNKVVNTFFESGWYHASLPFRLLLPLLWLLSLLFTWVANCRRRTLEQNRIQPLSVPVIIVGNISVGGTGKTPLLASLASALRARGLQPGIISRGYGGSYRGVARTVAVTDAAAEVGDEPLLLAQRTGCPVVIGKDRVAAAQALIAQGVSVILSDDGLQHYALPRSVEIAVIDGQRGLGNGLCLPAGPLREPPTRLQSVDFVVSNGDAETRFRDDQFTMQVVPTCWRHLQSGEEKSLDVLPVNKPLHAVAGIGNPQRFFSTLRALGYTITERVLPDHHAFSPADITFADDAPVVITEKDAVKCCRFAGQQVYALIVSAVLPDHFIHAVLDKIQEK